MRRLALGIGLAWLGGGAAVGAEAAKAEVRAAEFAPPECVLSGPVTVELGQVPQLTVAVKHVGRGEILLVRSLSPDGSRDRFPQCEFEVDGPPQPPAQFRVRICGAHTEPLTLDRFVRVRPGEAFDPFGLPNRAPPAKFIRQSFAVPGEYRIRFRYSTEVGDPAFWYPERDRDGRPNAAVEGMIGLVPKFEVCSNEIKVLVIDPSR